MKKFVIVYMASDDAIAEMRKTPPEDMKKNMEPWKQWMEKYKESIVDPGAPLKSDRTVSSSGVSSDETGVVGYSIMQAEDQEKVLEMVKENPHLGWHEGCDIRVYEVAPMPS